MVVFLIYFGAFVSVALTNISVFLMCGAWFVLSIAFAIWYYRDVYCMQKEKTELLLNDHDEWYLIDAEGRMILLELLPDSFNHHLLIILRFKQGKYFVLTVDNLSRKMFRRLSVRLQFALSTSE